MSNSKKILYGIEDYIADKSKAQQTAVAGNTQTVQPALASAQQTGAVQPVKTEQKIETPSETEPPTPKQPAPTTTALPDTGGNIIQAKTEVNRPMTMIESAKLQMDQARQKVYDILNKKFVYNEKSSPLYSILQRQYEREADRAAGQAYARSVANTGGFGSSYATLAADEARRRTMEGFEDQQYALYQAAKDEFLSERQSAVEWYNMSKQLYADVSAEELDAAYDAGIAKWLENNDEASVRAYLTEQGYSENSINRAITMMKEYTVKNNTLDASLESQANTKAYNDAINTASSLASQGKTEEEIRAALIAGGTPAGIVDQIMSERLEQQYSDAANQAALEKIRGDKEATEAYNFMRGMWDDGSTEEEVRQALADAGYSEQAITRTMDALIEYRSDKLEIQAADAKNKEILKELADDEEAENAYKTGMSMWMNGSSEADVMAALAGEGYSQTAIERAILSVKTYAADMMKLDEVLNAPTDEKHTEEYKNSVHEFCANKYDGTNKEEIKTDLKNMGVPDDVIEEEMRKLEQSDEARLADKIAQYEKAPTLSGAVEIIADAKDMGKDGEYVDKIAQSVSKSFEEAMKDPNKAYGFLGIDESEWNSMSGEDKAATILEKAGEARKAGMLSAEGYYGVVEKDMFNGLDDVMNASRIPLTNFRNALDVLSGILTLEGDGLLGGDQAEDLFDAAVGRKEIQGLMDNWDGWLSDATLNKTQEEVFAQLIQAAYRTGLKEEPKKGTEIMESVTDRVTKGETTASGNPSKNNPNIPTTRPSIPKSESKEPQTKISAIMESVDNAVDDAWEAAGSIIKKIGKWWKNNW